MLNLFQEVDGKVDTITSLLMTDHNNANGKVAALESELATLQDKELGNTILIVEHNYLIIKKCDSLIDIGPCAGKMAARYYIWG